ncbi:hypothetical protein [Bradyrhizobium sp. 17-4]
MEVSPQHLAPLPFSQTKANEMKLSLFSSIAPHSIYDSDEIEHALLYPWRTTMNTAMQMMPMPMMMGGMMNPSMAGGMMPMMNMPMMGMPMMACQMKCTMTPTGMTCEMMPMDPAMKDMFMKCCESMMNMMQMGMPMMMGCGGMMMMCMPMKA